MPEARASLQGLVCIFERNVQRSATEPAAEGWTKKIDNSGDERRIDLLNKNFRHGNVFEFLVEEIDVEIDSAA